MPWTDLTLFAGVPGWAIACVAVAHFIGFAIRGAFGFGSNMPIVLLTTWLLGPHHAILLVVLTASFAQLHLLPQGLKTADWRVARSLLAGLLAGTAAGVWLFTRLPADWLTLILGLLISAVVLMDRFRALDWLSASVDLRAPPVTVSLSVTSGLVGTVSGGGGIYFLAAYLKRICPTPDLLRGTNLVLSGLFMLGRLVFVAAAGLLSRDLLAEAVLILPAVFLGTWTGTRFFRAATPRRFYAALQLLLLAAAVALVGRGLYRI